MNAKTLIAIKQHGETLLRAFPHSTERDPIALCKKLRLVESATRRIMTDYCNGAADEEQADRASENGVAKAAKLLGLDKCGIEMAKLFVNRDPRGCALKLDSDGDWFKHWQDTERRAGRAVIPQDWGGYGLIAPDLTQGAAR